MDAGVQGLFGAVDEPLGHLVDGDAGSQNVVAAAIEAQQLRFQGDRGGELLLEDRVEQAPADGEVRVRDRLW